jgi:hypothetical protein
MRVSLLPLCVVLVCGAACRDTTVIYPGATPTAPTVSSGGTTRSGADVVEFRVSGNATGARVRYSNTVDGLTQVVTTLPFLVTLTTTAPSLFLSLEATPSGFPFTIGFPFLSAQIFANGTLFREATSSDFFLQTITVTGTWRH